MKRLLVGVAALLVYTSFLFVMDARINLLFGASFLLSCVVIIVLVVYSGRRVKSIKHSQLARDGATTKHKAYLSMFLNCFCLGVFTVEVGVRRMGGLEGDLSLLLLHFTFVFMASVSFILAYYFLSGRQSQEHHAKVAYAFVVSYMLVSVTGTLLLMECFNTRIPI